MIDVMLDLETFGNGKNACIVQIGACYFNRLTGEIGEEIELTVDARTSVRAGGVIDADTVYFWLKQSPQAIEGITNNMTSIDDALAQMNLFFKGAKHIWSHATFDFPILMEAFRDLNIRFNGSYRSARDIRTLMDLSGVKTKDFVREGTHHTALADCKFQVKYCVEAFRVLELAK